MTDPIAYSFGSPDAFQMALNGLQAGQQAGQARAAIPMALGQQTLDQQAGQRAQQGLDQSQQRLGMVQQQFANEQTLFVQQQADVATQKARAAAFQSGMTALAQKGKAATSEDYAALIQSFPEMAKEASTAWDAMSSARQGSELKFGAQVYMALQNDQTDAAIQMLKDHAKAAEDAGDKPRSDMAKGVIATIQAHPESAMVSLRLYGDSATGSQFSKLIDNANGVKAGSGVAQDHFVRTIPKADGSRTDMWSLSGAHVYDKNGAEISGAAIADVNAQGTQATVDLAGSVAGAKQNAKNEANIATGGAAAAAVAGGAAVGGSAGTAITMAPVLQGQLDLIDKNINEILLDPKLPGMIGPLDARTPSVFPAAVALKGKMDQLVNQAWSQAYQTLKKGGSITEAETAAATAALSRATAAQYSDVAAYTQALKDFQAAVHRGMQALQEQTKQTTASLPAQPGTQGPPSLGVFDPAAGLSNAPTSSKLSDLIAKYK